MKILLINGSPKGDGSNTLKLSNAFLEGMGENELKVLQLSKMNIAPCKGCFCCWSKTPGKCIIADDMKTVIDDQLWADIIIWSFPLYFFNVPGLLKNLIDRQLPMSLPFMSNQEGTGSGSHDSRYDMSGKKHILISTCGFYTSEKNYDSVTRMFDHFLGENNYEKIFCGQGELFRVPELKGRTDQYLQIVKQAGAEYVSGGISNHTKGELAGLLYPRDVFEKMADSSWGIEKTTGEPEDESLRFTRQMAALYNKNSFDGNVRVIEICYTDLGKTYQIELTDEGSRVLTDNSLIATTRIDTPWDVWLSIARGEIRGDAALANGMYHVNGDFSLMINWDAFFGSGGSEKKTEPPQTDNKTKKPLMTTMLAAWIVFWCAVSINTVTGGIIAAVCSAVIPLIMHGRMTIYDSISCGAVQLLSLLAVLTGTYELPVVLGYGIFGLMWLVSCFTKEPLCAAYVKYNYGGGDALNNPIFMKTNRILAAGWGILYVLIAGWSWPLLGAEHVALLQIINNSMTALMGVFTAWFEHWYPAHVAKG